MILFYDVYKKINSAITFTKKNMEGSARHPIMLSDDEDQSGRCSASDCALCAEFREGCGGMYNDNSELREKYDVYIEESAWLKNAAFLLVKAARKECCKFMRKHLEGTLTKNEDNDIFAGEMGKYMEVQVWVQEISKNPAIIDNRHITHQALLRGFMLAADGGVHQIPHAKGVAELEKMYGLVMDHSLFFRQKSSDLACVGNRECKRYLKRYEEGALGESALDYELENEIFGVKGEVKFIYNYLKFHAEVLVYYNEKFGRRISDCVKDVRFLVYSGLSAAVKGNGCDDDIVNNLSHKYHYNVQQNPKLLAYASKLLMIGPTESGLFLKFCHSGKPFGEEVSENIFGKGIVGRAFGRLRLEAKIAVYFPDSDDRDPDDCVGDVHFVICCALEHALLDRCDYTLICCASAVADGGYVADDCAAGGCASGGCAAGGCAAGGSAAGGSDAGGCSSELAASVV